MATTVLAAEALSSTPPETTLVRYVNTEDPHRLQEELARAVQEVRENAVPGERRGILLTRHGRSLYTVEASADVPYGITLERDLWHRRDVGGSDQNRSRDT